MGRPLTNSVNKYYSIDSINRKSECKVFECKTILNSIASLNFLKNHLKTMHNTIYDILTETKKRLTINNDIDSTKRKKLNIGTQLTLSQVSFFYEDKQIILNITQDEI